MTKTELIAAVAGEMEGTTKSHVRGFLTALTTVAARSLKKDKKFVLPGVLKIALVNVPAKAERKARMGRNPQTGAAIKIKAKTVVKFRVAKAAKDVIAPTKK